MCWKMDITTGFVLKLPVLKENEFLQKMAGQPAREEAAAQERLYGGIRRTGHGS